MENPYQAPSADSSPPPLPMPGVEGLKNPRLLGLFAVFFYALGTLGEVADHFQRSFPAEIGISALHQHDTYYVVAEGLGLFEWLMLGAFLAGILFFFLWKYRAARNAWILDPSVMKMTPAMSVGCYFIPILNFIWPCRAMAGIAKASYGSTAGVALWWSTQMIALVGGIVVVAMLGEHPPDAVPTMAEHLLLLWSIFTFVCAWKIVMRISKAQAARCAA
ncbi:DUF4328 domain-containing protein [Luteolibacter luteus]|uniref:DUF4328 domain-containing protein n=1 Tax=Luteolibacter luteus TaxID=2728835 RepID=A0A858RL65_9BACT|nr:DUF4328 domain-containing protein [Luteolibacter luteus]QJE96753.1 DUF4328 domain-containing protein [Luteolibacter luteus]